MNQQTILLELLMGGFFAVACLKTSVPSASDGLLHFSNFLQFPDRMERLRRSRWQWFSMVALLLVVRMQRGVPLVLEVTLAMQFLVFFALPTRLEARAGGLSR